jgi:hypothetical protein
MENKNENEVALNSEIFPNNEQVRLIFRDTYIYYTKWIAVKEPDWDLVLSEGRILEAKYPFELCRKILVEIISIIEFNTMKGGLPNG